VIADVAGLLAPEEEDDIEDAQLPEFDGPAFA
jgi:hypothetical protein